MAYRGQRSNPAAVPQGGGRQEDVGHGYSDGDDYYEDDGDYVNGEYDEEPQQQQPQAAAYYNGRGGQPNFAEQEAIEADSTRGQHIDKRFVTKATCITKFFDVDFVGSGVQFGKGHVDPVWRIADHLQDELKFIDTDVDRHLAKPEQKKGNVRRMCLLGFSLVEHGSTAPYAVDLVCDKYLMPSTISAHNASLHRIQAHTAVTPFKHNVFQPTSYIDEYIYKNGVVCDRDLVESWVQEFPEKNTAMIEVGDLANERPTLAYSTLVHNMFHEDDKKRAWKKEPLTAKQRETILNPDGAAYVQVTAKIGSMIKTRLLRDVADFEKRCIDANVFAISMRRSDGIDDFASPDNLIGEILDSNAMDRVGASASSSTENHEVPIALKTRFGVHSKFKARLILF